MTVKETKRKQYIAPKLTEYGDLGRLIRGNPNGAILDGGGSKTVPFKTG